MRGACGDLRDAPPVLTAPTFPTDSTPYVFDRRDVVGYETAHLDASIGLQPTGTIPSRCARAHATRPSHVC
jgi:hypothetical protein